MKNKSAIIVYSTGSGNTEIVAEAVGSGLEESEFTVKMSMATVTDPKEIEEYDLVILACPTYNVGKLQDYFVKFYKELIKNKYEGKNFAVIGLGFSKHYDIFCASADILAEAVEKVGGNLIVPPLKVDGYPYAYLEDYKAWGKLLAGKVK